MLRLPWHRRHDLNLDRPTREGLLSPFDLPCRWEFCRVVLRLMLSDGFPASHWFHHEDPDYVRCCLWRAEQREGGVWYEYCPMSGNAGLLLLRELRHDTRIVRRDHSRIWGELRYKHKGRPGAFVVDSLHDRDVRLWVPGQPAPRLPYELVFAGVTKIEIGESNRGRS